MPKLTVHCPKCGGAEIRERNVAVEYLPVIGWEVIDGDLLPRDYSGAEAEWEIDDGADLYSCADTDCGWKGDLAALVIRGGANG